MRPYIYFAILIISLYFLVFSFRKPFVTFYYFLAIFPFIFGFSSLAGYEKFPLIRVINIIFFIFTSINYLLSKASFPYKNIKLFLLGFFISGFISSIMSKYPLESIFRLLTYFEPLIWFFISYYAFSTYGNMILLKKIAFFSLIGFSFFLLYGLYEFITQSNIFYDKGILIAQEVNYLEEKRFLNTGRLSSTIGQPVYASIFALVMVAYLISYKDLFKYVKRYIIYLIIGFSILFIFFTGTRASILGLFLFGILYYAFYQKNVIKVLFFQIFFLIASYFILNLFAKDFLTYILESLNIEGGVYTSENTNFMFRIELTLIFIEKSLDNLIIGIGPGFIQKSYFLFGDYSFFGLTGVENQYATLLLENGILGLFFYLAFLLSLLFEVNSNNEIFFNKDFQNFIGKYIIITKTIFISILIIAVTVYIANSIIMYYLFLNMGIILGLFNNKTSIKN